MMQRRTQKRASVDCLHGAGAFERLSGSQLGLIVNLDDPTSLEIADYYQVKRGVPGANIVRLRVPVRAQIDRVEFAPLKQQVDEQLPATVQALAIAWTMPARVECNSITSAFARGFKAAPCDTHSCKLDQPSPYYDTNSTRPFSDFGMRPAMMLAGWSVQDVKALIDRGVASDQTNPTGIAALLRRQFPPKSSGTYLQLGDRICAQPLCGRQDR